MADPLADRQAVYEEVGMVNFVLADEIVRLRALIERERQQYELERLHGCKAPVGFGVYGPEAAHVTAVHLFEEASDKNGWREKGVYYCIGCGRTWYEVVHHVPQG